MKIIFNKKLNFDIDEKLSNFLNIMRWVAAFVVILSHLRAFSFPAFSNINNPNIFEYIFYFITSLGHQAVMIFFVISGFLISREVIKPYNENNFVWKIYLTKRIVRLYLVLIPALILTFFFDSLGYHFFNYNSLYDKYFDGDKETLLVFLKNLFMLQHSYGPTFGTNDPLWSLAYEFWYYLMFPLILGVLNIKKILVKIIYLIILIVLILILSLKIKIYFLCWLCGVLIWYVRDFKLFNKKIYLFLNLFVFLVTLVLSRYVHSFYTDFSMAISFSLLICFYKHPLLFNLIKNVKLNKTMADFSYSIYLLHYSMTFLLYNVLYIYLYDLTLYYSLNNYFIFISSIILIYIVIYYLATVIEFKTKYVTNTILKK